MDAQMLDSRIDDLLDDPVTSLLIEADGVDRSGLARQLRRLNQLGRHGQASPRRENRDRRPQAAWRLLSPVLCGACAP